MSASDNLSVIVAGGGIGGLTAAICLARKGYRVCVMEQSDAFREVGAGIQLSPNATHILHAIGLEKDLERFAVRPESIDVFEGASGNRLSSFPLDPVMEKRFDAPYYTVSRSDLHSALAKLVISNPKIDVHFQTRLLGVGAKGEQVAVKTEMKDERLYGDILIGADGVWSMTRHLVVEDDTAAYTGHTAWRGLIDIEDAPKALQKAAVHLWLGAKSHLVHYPVAGGKKINVVAITEGEWEEEGWNHPGNARAMLMKFAGWADEPRQMIRSLKKPLKWALCGRQPDYSWHGNGRVTLLGDAAHPMLPYLAQGAVMAIEDAYALAEELGKAVGDPEPALRAYEAVRAPRTGRIQQGAFDNARHYHYSGRQAMLRNMALRAAGLAPGLFMRRYDWIYGKKFAKE